MPITRRAMVAGALAGAATARAFAQPTTQARPAPGAELDAITDVADALGMIRGTGRNWKSVNRIYLIADGTIAPAPGQPAQRLTRGFIEMSFTLPAIRSDLTLLKSRSIEVARGETAWNETEPGIGATAATGQANARLWRIYTVPHGAVRAAMEAFVRDPASLKFTKSGNVSTFDVVSPAGPLRIIADAKNRPTRTELKLGDATIVTDLTDYRDWEKLGVWFPARIRQTAGGAVVADLTVSEYRTNPYAIFPYPPGMAPPGASQHPA